MVEMTKTVVFAVYMLILLGIGYVASTKIDKTPDDFYLAGRNIGTAVLALTLMATVASAWGVFGIAATAYGTGIGVAVFVAVMAVLTSVMLALVGDKVARSGRKFGIVTPSEFIRKRYDSDLASITYVLTSTIFLTAFVGTQIIGGGVALKVIAGIPYEIGVLTIAVIMTFYIHIAGMQGVVWSDALQGGLMVFGLFLSGIVLLVISGPANLAANVAAESPGLMSLVGPHGVWTPIYILTFGLFFMIGVPAYPQVFQRLLSSRSRKTLKRSILLFPLLLIAVEVTAGILGLWAVGIIPAPENPDYVLPLMIDQIFPTIFTAVILSAAVAALMSTGDSILLSISSLISRDIYHEYVNPDASEKKEVKVTQGILLGLIALATALAFIQPSGIFELGSFAVAGHTALAPALFGSYFWKGATKEGAITSMFVSGLLMILYFVEIIPPEYTFGMHYGFIGAVVAIVLYIAVSLVTTPPTSEKTIGFVHS